MLFRSPLILLATLSAAVATPITTRDARTDQLVQDLLRLDQSIKNSLDAVGNYTGGVAAYQPLRDAFLEIDSANRIAYSKAMAISPLANSVAPDIRAAIDALIAKKLWIDAAGLSSETANSVNLLNSENPTLGMAIPPKLNQKALPTYTGPVQQIEADCRRGVTAFGGVPSAP
ncbi:hypothetical protein LTR56_000453 [Elasticomyces elasticus]|nr:hypothetical protein LTR22_014181 [Elasticomyces elasticus]KAK3660695.1 hypothetical protein LTR56_000453 [Elasticomyces elasticus]KAK4922841.1 hypothetical protein LTR49_009848 [Elasticomyces elasticus]KAK5759782.1 hypothetical protein LTS12_010122 [Elasticomyces elasticus]